MDQAARGATALANSNYDLAIKEYTDAIAANSTAVKYYIQRSTAYQRSSKYSEALADAEIAVVLAHKRANRELIKDAQLRRGIALYFVERYADAEMVLAVVKKLDEKEKSLAIWNMKVAKKLKELEKGDERGKITAKEVPDVEVPSASTSKAKPAPGKSESKKAEEIPAAPKPVVPTPANKIKHDWYQNNENVVFTLLAKGVPKDKAIVEITKDTLSISFPIQDSSSDFNYTIDPFYAEIDPSASTFAIKATKVEVTLRKALPGTKWHALEGDRETISSTDPSDQKSSIPSHILSQKNNDQPPSYPTSSRKGAKNWDKVADDLTKKKAKGEDGEEGDDYAADDYEGDETSRFFKQLYKGATQEQQRAMMKSYQESGGTVLSTDWSQVGSKTVVPEPPDGMEAKKY